MAKKKIRFLKSPTGAYGYAYSKGDEVEVDIEQGIIDDMQKHGYIEMLESAKAPAKKASVTKARTAKKK